MIKQRENEKIRKALERQEKICRKAKAKRERVFRNRQRAIAHDGRNMNKARHNANRADHYCFILVSDASEFLKRMRFV